MRIMLGILMLWGVNVFAAVGGDLTAHESIVLSVSRGDKSFGPGDFEAKVSRRFGGDLKLEVILPGPRNNPEATFKVPRGKKIPRNNGTLELAAAESGQPYDLYGIWDTQTSDGPERWEQQTCQYPIREQFCYPTPGGGLQCEVRERWVMGWQEVRYFTRTHDLTVTLEMSKPDAQNASAHFVGHDISTERVYTYQGFCR